MRANPEEPRPSVCPSCGARVVLLYLPAGRELLVERAEVMAEALEPGLYVAVDAAGEARSLRWPGELKRGDAVYRIHDMSCQL